MEVEYQATNEFERSLHALSPKDQTRVKSVVNRVGDAALNNRAALMRHVRRAYSGQLRDGSTPSVYVARAGHDLRVLLAIDPDPLFARTIVTLLDCVRHDKMERSLRSLARKLYSQKIDLGNLGADR